MESDPVSGLYFDREMTDLFGSQKRFVQHDENMEEKIVSF